MIAVSLLALAQAAAPASPPADPSADDARAQEIVVLGKKLDKWKGKIKFEKSGISCRTTHSTGDRKLDPINCRAFQQCGQLVSADLEIWSKQKLPKATLEQHEKDAFQIIANCMKDLQPKLVAELADKEMAARAEASDAAQ